MTREDAVKVLNAIWKYKHCGFSEKEIREALDMGIKALESCKNDKYKAFNSAMFIRGLYNGLRMCRPDYNADNYKWVIGKAVMNEFDEQNNKYRYRPLPISENTATLYGIKVKVDNINRYDIKLYEDITNKIDVERNKNVNRYEIIKMLTSLKEQAVNGDSDTLIKYICLDSFEFVINSAIKLLEAESEEK